MKISTLVTVPLIFTGLVASANITEEEYNELDLFWSYGGSEPVYPTPETKGLGRWANAYTKAKALVSKMTNDEKNNVTYGQVSTSVACSGVSGSVPRLGFPGLCFQDAGNGVRGVVLVNAYASGIHVGASWNTKLANDRAVYMGEEFRKRGANVAFGPVSGPLGRVAKGGRNFEGFSNDPYLCGKLTYESVEGLQQNVVASVKHLIANEQETKRMPNGDGNWNQSLSSNLDDKSMHELYLWPFQDAVKAGAGSVMCAENRVNNSYACQNSKLMNGLLKEELGFQGFVITDWYAQHTGVEGAIAGLDMVMPVSETWMDGNLTKSVTNGTLDQSRLDDMAIRIVASYYLLDGEDLGEPGFGLPLDGTELFDSRNPASKPTIFQGAVEGQVLVKNVNNALPLKKPTLISLFGYDGVAQAINNPSSDFFAMGRQPAQQFPNGSAVDWNMITSLFSSNPTGDVFGTFVALNGTLINGGGSGANTPAYIDAPFDAFQRQAYEDDTFLLWDFASPEPTVDQHSQAAFVFINAYASEGSDRHTLSDEYSDNLVKSVASQCNNTIVVIHNAGIRLVDQWIDHPNITAVIFAHLPGQDSGRALVEIIYGKQSPSGRLPYTVAKNETDYGHMLNPDYAQGDIDPYFPQSNFTEGVYIDYRYFSQKNITPRYEFGYGLTYTTFDYSNLIITNKSGVDTGLLPPGSGIQEGGLSSLWDVIMNVEVTVKNAGEVEAQEVPQLYIGIPNGPEKVLRGFNKKSITPNSLYTFSFDLTRRDLSTWDTVKQQWVLQKGSYNVYVGKSVLDIQLTESFEI